MAFGIVYDRQTGAIRNTVRAAFDEHLDAYETAELAVLRSDPIEVNVMMQYVANGAIVDCVVPNVTLSTKVADLGETVSLSGIPSDAFVQSTVEEEEYATVNNGQYLFTSNDAGQVVVTLVGKYAGQFVVTFDGLSAAKDRAKLSIDEQAEAARGRVVTPGSGQAMTYLRKADAAHAFLAGQTLAPAQTQRLEDEAARLNVTVEEAAQTIATTAQSWEMLDAAIDDIRLTKKLDVTNAANGTAIDEILAGINWPV